MNFPSNTLEILRSLVIRNLKVRYKGSVVGFFWTFLNPLLTTLILYIVFSYIVKIGIKGYPLFLLSALLPWGFFSASLGDASRSLVDNAPLVKKAYFRREILPISYVVSNFVNFLIGICVLLPLVIVLRPHVLTSIFCLPVVLAAHLLFTTGLALFLSCANVYLRDVSHVTEISLMLWFYLTPVFYPVSMVPSRFHGLYMLNPMASIITMYRNMLFDGIVPSAESLFGIAAVSAVLLSACYLIFRKYEPSLAKYI
ncbi:MAG: ABC transporter permease [Candidatus Omnitrophota bacterium]